MKRLLKSKILIVVATFGLVAFVMVFFTWPMERTEVRNLSGQTITDVVLELHDHDTPWSVTKKVTSLAPGQSVGVRHSHTDTKATVLFAIAGHKFRHDEGYIDLWTGEGWRFDIQPDGAVRSGSYDVRGN